MYESVQGTTNTREERGSRWRYHFVAFFLLILLYPGLAFSQADAVLRGIVRSADDGKTLQGASIVLVGLESDVERAAASNVDGYFEIRKLRATRYRLRVSFVGFETYEDTLSLSSDERQSYNVRLSPRETQLEEVRVEVEGGAVRRQAGFQTANSEDVGRVPTPGPTGDVASYLQTLPGVVTGGDRGGNLHVRGGTSSQNLFFVDDLPVVKPLHISNLYSAFPEEAVKNVDVYAGGFGAEFLGATSSVVDVSLREGNTEQHAARASLSPFISSMRVEGPLEQGRQSYFGILRRSTVEETAGPLFNREIPLGFYDFTGRYTLQGDDVSCSITGIRTSDQGRLSTERNTRMAWSNTAAGGRCILFGSGLDHALEISSGYSRFRNSAGASGEEGRSAGLEKGFLDLERKQRIPWGGLRLGIRSEFTYYDYTIDQKFAPFGAKEIFGGTLQAFGSLDAEVGDALTLRPSIGFQLNSRTSPITYEPRFRLTYRPDGTSQKEVSLAVGKYNQVAEGISDTQDAGTEFNIWTPEGAGGHSQRALHAIVGYRQRFSENFQISVEGYAKRISNIPVPEWNPVDRFETDLTSADGRAYGADARVEITPDPAYIFAGYGWSQVRYTAAQDDLGAWIDGAVFEYAPSHDRRHQANIVTGIEFGQTTANVRWEVGSGRPYTKAYGFDLALDVNTRLLPPTRGPGRSLVLYDEPYGGRLPAYHRLDVSISRLFEVAPNTTLQGKAGAINVYDRRNVFYYDVSRDNIVRQMPLYPYISVSVSVN